MNILITGGAGYIGSHTSLSLIDRGHKVTIIDNLITGNLKLIPKKAEFINSDIADLKKIEKTIQNEKFDCVMHFAGLVKVEESIRDPDKYNLYNYEKAKIFFQCCIKNGLNKIIFSSTAGVYGAIDKNKKVNEKDKLNPLNPYASTKQKLENYLVSLSKKNKLKFVILRYFNVAGADKNRRSGPIIKNSNNLIKVLCEVATKKKDKIIVNGNDYGTKDGTPIRDFIHVSDLADIHIIAADHIHKNGESDIYNCGYGVGYSVKDVINEMENLTRSKMNCELGERRKGDIPFSVSDNLKFKNKFKWTPKYNNLSFILKSALDWEKGLDNEN